MEISKWLNERNKTWRTNKMYIIENGRVTCSILRPFAFYYYPYGGTKTQTEANESQQTWKNQTEVKESKRKRNKANRSQKM